MDTSDSCLYNGVDVNGRVVKIDNIDCMMNHYRAEFLRTFRLKLID